MKLLIEDNENDKKIFAGLEPNGNITIQIDNDVVELSPKKWNKIISFIDMQIAEKEEDERLSKSWINRLRNINSSIRTKRNMIL